jgi:hypothetical protein
VLRQTEATHVNISPIPRLPRAELEQLDEKAAKLPCPRAFDCAKKAENRALQLSPQSPPVRERSQGRCTLSNRALSPTMNGLFKPARNCLALLNKEIAIA